MELPMDPQSTTPLQQQKRGKGKEPKDNNNKKKKVDLPQPNIETTLSLITQPHSSPSLPSTTTTSSSESSEKLPATVLVTPTKKIQICPYTPSHYQYLFNQDDFRGKITNNYYHKVVCEKKNTTKEDKIIIEEGSVVNQYNPPKEVIVILIHIAETQITLHVREKSNPLQEKYPLNLCDVKRGIVPPNPSSPITRESDTYFAILSAEAKYKPSTYSLSPATHTLTPKKQSTHTGISVAEFNILKSSVVELTSTLDSIKASLQKLTEIAIEMRTIINLIHSDSVEGKSKQWEHMISLVNAVAHNPTSKK
eukprot:TRINITY_DN1198_c0_g2_i3.p1 TRINITY_DN1198_c0_g2~~TRINITY_DN1198_c0_g2_i3.p1  ORF type:complete len:308 (-),score=79.53 TRINITY_DN1198_c0_g2_i3:121-1044(-)